MFSRAAAAADALPPLGVSVAVARVGQGAAAASVVDDAFVARHLARANEIFGEHGLSFAEVEPRRPLASGFADLETRTDRDALAAELVDKRINIFFVRSLRDVDDPKLFRMGVTWRKLSNLRKRYVIVAANSLPTTSAHELGHFLGNEHAYVRNNLMSYLRDDESTHPHIFLDAAQGARAQRTARALLAKGELAA
jgi:hypothetical protein